MNMTKEFRIVQVYKLNNNGNGISIEIAPEEKVDVNNIEMSNESIDSLYRFMKDDWKTEKIAVVEFDGYYNDGYTPKNPVIKHIKYAEN